VKIYSLKQTAFFSVLFMGNLINYIIFIIFTANSNVKKTNPTVLSGGWVSVLTFYSMIEPKKQFLSTAKAS